MGTDSASKPDSTVASSSRTLLYLTGGLFTLWVTGLSIMAVWTTNLPVLNPRQIELASLVVTGIPESVESGSILVQAVWKGTTLKQSLVINELSRTAAVKGERWIFPLIDSPDGDGTYAIAPYSESLRGQDPNRPQGLLIYPSSPQLEEQLKSLLAAHSD